MSRVSRRIAVGAGDDAPAPSSAARRTASPAGRAPASSSHKKKKSSGDFSSAASSTARVASPVGPQRRRSSHRSGSGDSGAPVASVRASSPPGVPFIAESLFSDSDDAIAPAVTKRASTKAVAPAAPAASPQTPATPAGSWDPNDDESHPYRRMRHAAELGKMQLGFHNDQYIEDISVEYAYIRAVTLGFLYKPHTVTALLIIVGVLLYLAFRTDLQSADDWVHNVRVGVGAAAFFVLVLGMLIFPSGPFIRPHPVVWRLAFGVAVLYEMWLIILLFQSKDHARQSMKFFDSSLGVPVSERSYAANCELTWSNVKGNIDIFVLSHFLGWLVKALILRDWLICWVISVQWELIEILFMHMLPNFAECWWDQWILDVGLSNALGIFIGCKLAGYLEMKEYKWGSYGSIPSFVGKAKRTMLQFTPASWTKVEWKPTSSLKRIFAVQVLIVCMHLEELNAFFLKYILWVPPECKLNLVRLIIWAFVGVPCMRQIYSYLTDPHCKRIGHQTFLSLVVLLTELIVIVKFGEGEFPNPMPENVKIGLATFLVLYGAGLAAIMLRVRGGSGGTATPTPGSPALKPVKAH